ncbi:NAD(P)-dependent oxidoreductase [Subtercola sp. YIM 133946]|uniref:NAD(P)-dependent oxidoreductase n=1 Tax=Subtercola sp. YIM 133946 TaxID=3118909 RepID=UPI002F94EF3C
MKILAPKTIELDLTGGVGGADGADATSGPADEVVLYDPERPFADADRDAEVLVVWGNSAENLADAVDRLGALRLVQTLAAGPDAVLDAGFDDAVAITSGRSLHDATVAEHALALILAAVRRLDDLIDASHRHEWNTAFNRAQADPATAQRYTLDGGHVTIWGFGSIAGRLAPLLRMLGSTVTGVATSPGERDGFTVVTPDDAGATLADTDVLVSLLPATAATANTFDAALFARLKPGAVFVNVGRGPTVDEDALLAGLAAGTPRVAALDVTKVEPLPEGSGLWDAPGVILTPHVAGNRPRGASELVRANLAALRGGGQLVNRVR